MIAGGLLAVAGATAFVVAAYPLWIFGGICSLVGLGLLFLGAFRAGALIAV